MEWRPVRELVLHEADTAAMYDSRDAHSKKIFSMSPLFGTNLEGGVSSTFWAAELLLQIVIARQGGGSRQGSSILLWYFT